MKKFDIAASAYKGLTREQWEKDLNYHPNFAVEVPIDDDVNRLSRIVFAPGADGNPTSDISYYLSCGDEGFREYMKNMLLKEHDGTIVSDDSELAGAVVRKNLQTYQEYVNHIDSYIHKQMNSKEK